MSHMGFELVTSRLAGRNVTAVPASIVGHILGPMGYMFCMDMSFEKNTFAGGAARRNSTRTPPPP